MERERERERERECARAQTSERERATERERSLMRVVCSPRESERAQKESASGKARERVERETDRTRRRSSNAGHGGVAMAALLPLLVSPCVTSVPHAYSYTPHAAWQERPRAPPASRARTRGVQVRRECACCAAPFSPHAITCRQTFHTLHACMMVCYRVPMGPSPRCCGRCVGGCATTATAPAARTMLIEAMVATTHTLTP